MAVELQKIITSELHSFTVSTVGSEMDIDLAKGFSNTVSDFRKPQNIQVDKLLLTLPLCAKKASDRAREEIKDITTLGSSGCLCWWLRSSGGGHAHGAQDVLVVGMCAARGWPPLFLYPLGAHLIAS